jgi:hypothetical protein
MKLPVIAMKFFFFCVRVFASNHGSTLKPQGNLLFLKRGGDVHTDYPSS